MKYSFLGFSVKKIMEFSLDIKDLAILRYFDDFRESGRMNYETIEGEKYYWVSYQSFAKEMPYLGLEKRSIMARMLKLRDLGILNHYTKKEGGTFSYFKLGDKFYELFENGNSVFKNDNTMNSLEEEVHFNDEAIHNDDEMVSTKSDRRCVQKCSSKTNLLKDSSAIDTNLYKYIKEANEIISYLNLNLGTSYKDNNKGTLILINKRINEGYTVDDFKTVVDKKIKTWENTKFEQYLNPQTLFGDKFEIYLNQNILKEEKNNKQLKDYREPRKLRFNNFKGRDYDYDDLEKRLLGWA